MGDVAAPRTVSDVHRLLVQRIRAQIYAPGARLPSVRELAEELGSNPSTVDRAIHRLIAVGAVRSVPRRGVFVADTTFEDDTSNDDIEDDVRQSFVRAWSAGIPIARIRELADEGIAAIGRVPRIAFVECNQRDLANMARLISNASGVALEPLLIEELGDRKLDDEFDVVVAPIFHLPDLESHVRDFDRVVDVGFVVSAPVLRRLATTSTTQRVAVLAPTERGARRLGNVAAQYFPGEIQTFLVGRDDPETLIGAGLILASNAAPVPESVVDRVSESVELTWELDPGFSSTFRSRVDHAVALSPGR